MQADIMRSGYQLCRLPGIIGDLLPLLLVDGIARREPGAADGGDQRNGQTATKQAVVLHD